MAFKYTLLASQWSYGHFLKLSDSVLFASHDKCLPFSSTHYVLLYPQNGDRNVTIDYVTSLHRWSRKARHVLTPLQAITLQWRRYYGGGGDVRECRCYQNHTKRQACATTLPARPLQNIVAYSLRPRQHSKQLISETTELNNRDYIVPMWLYKDAYWRLSLTFKYLTQTVYFQWWMWLLNLCLHAAAVMYNYRNMRVKVAYDNSDNKRRYDDDHQHHGRRNRSGRPGGPII